jgi:MFS family permease
VTQVREREERGGNPFREVLARPGALRFSAAGFVGRMPISMFGLGTVLLIASVTGRYALAGIVAGAGSVGYALCAPQAARLADRLGQQRVLRPLTAFFAVSTMALIICAEFRAPLWTMLVSGALAGASMPSLGSMVRARWSALLGDSPLLHTAFSLESVLDEAIFVIGPAVVTLLATEVTPAAGVAVAMTACVIGTLLFAAQYRTEPLAGPASAPQRAGASEPEGLKGVSEASGGHRSRIPAPGLVTLAPVYFCLGTMFGTIDLSTVDFCASRGHKPLAGFVLGAYALGSAVGGLCYGSRTWRAPVHRRFALTLCTVAAGTATFWALPGLAVLTVVIFCSGLAISPTFIAGFSLIGQQAPAKRRTEGMAWLTSAISVGVAAGSAVAGHVIDAGGARSGYVLAAGCGALASAACLLGLHRLH